MKVYLMNGSALKKKIRLPKYTNSMVFFPTSKAIMSDVLPKAKTKNMNIG